MKLSLIAWWVEDQCYTKYQSNTFRQNTEVCFVFLLRRAIDLSERVTKHMRRQDELTKSTKFDQDESKIDQDEWFYPRYTTDTFRQRFLYDIKLLMKYTISDHKISTFFRNQFSKSNDNHNAGLKSRIISWKNSHSQKN